MKTSDIRVAIRSHYPTSEYAVMWEVGNATGSRNRRWADAVVMNLWPSRGLSITGIEIKVSRSDWKRELENPAKAEEIATYCDYWTVFAPEGIIQLHEVPSAWGVKVVNEKGAVRQIKEPLRNMEPKPLDRGFVAAMLRRASTADENELMRLVEKRVASELAGNESRIARQVENETFKFNKINKKVAELKALGLDLNDWEGTDAIARYYSLGRKLAQADMAMKMAPMKKRLGDFIETLDLLEQEFAGIIPAEKE